VTTIVSGPTTVAFGYDDANRQIWEDQTLSGFPTRRVNTTPDIDGNRASLSVTTGATTDYGLTYDYTERQALAHVKSPGGTVYFEFTYDKNGNLTKRQNVWQGLDSTNFEYDNLNRVTLCEQTGANDVPFAASHYAYDSVGNLQYTWRNEEGNKGERFTYDADNQLKTVFYNADAPWNATPTGFDRSAAYYYSADRLNRIKMGDNQNGSVVWTDYTPNGLNQYTAVTAQAPVYNGNFHLYFFNGWTYVYDADARLTSAIATGHSAQMVYDGLGRCVKRTIDGEETFFTYDGWKPIVEWNNADSLIARNIYGAGADEILTRYQVGIGYLHYHLDRLGNVQFLLNQSNIGIEKYTYDAFGRPKITDWAGNPRVDADGNPASAYGNRFMFTGREYLSTLGIYDYRHRHYHPGLGRFLQTDPKGFEAGDQNLFRYVGNNPVNAADPSGLDTFFGYRTIGTSNAIPFWSTKAYGAHQFVFTRSADGTVSGSWGWGERNFIMGAWDQTGVNSYNDKTAAASLLASRPIGAQRVGDSSLDPFVSRAHAILAREPAHLNGFWNGGVCDTCQGQAVRLVDLARALQAGDISSLFVGYSDRGNPVYQGLAVSGFDSNGQPIYSEGNGTTPQFNINYVNTSGGGSGQPNWPVGFYAFGSVAIIGPPLQWGWGGGSPAPMMAQVRYQ
jgi:RHS repeat-associated protein